MFYYSRIHIKRGLLFLLRCLHPVCKLSLFFTSTLFLSTPLPHPLWPSFLCITTSKPKCLGAFTNAIYARYVFPSIISFRSFSFYEGNHYTSVARCFIHDQVSVVEVHLFMKVPCTRPCETLSLAQIKRFVALLIGLVYYPTPILFSISNSFFFMLIQWTGCKSQLSKIKTSLRNEKL